MQAGKWNISLRQCVLITATCMPSPHAQQNERKKHGAR